jgi:hypothetical protein
MAMTDTVDTRFSLVTGGPFYRLQARLGLLGPNLLPPMRTALLYVAVAWIPLAIMTMLQGHAWSSALGERTFFLDYASYARFIIGIFMLMLMEPIADRRIAIIIRQFRDGGLVTPEEQQLFQSALDRADRRSSLAQAEYFLLITAYCASINAVYQYLTNTGGSWMGSIYQGDPTLTVAGWWVLLVSLPLFWFLILRWLWLFIVWTVLLRDLSQLNLRLVATHPDRSGGIGFLGMFPPTFASLAFALSCTAAAVVLQEVVFSRMSLNVVSALFALWVVLVMTVFVGPLAVFIPMLSRLKERALLEYGSLATNHNRAFQTKWVGSSPEERNALGAADFSSLADLAIGFEIIRSMGFVPADFNTVKALLLASSLPWLAIALTQIPLVELLATLAQLFL